MQAKLIELFSKYLLMPLFEKGLKLIYQKVMQFIADRKEKQRRKKELKNNLKKAQEYEDSSIDDAANDFSKLP